MLLPGGARPACTQCLKDTISVFAAASGSGQSGVRNNYAQAAQVVDLTCGPGFVEAGLATSGGAKLAGNGGLLMGMTALVAILIVVFLCLGQVLLVFYLWAQKSSADSAA
jgi:hypothetical protein